jgi:hypothetical protein
MSAAQSPDRPTDISPEGESSARYNPAPIRALIDEHRPPDGASPRHMSLAVGLHADFLNRYTKDSADLKSIDLEQAKNLARALGCELWRASEALNESIGLPWGPPIDDPAIRRVVRRFHHLTHEQRDAALKVSAAIRLMTPEQLAVFPTLVKELAAIENMRDWEILRATMKTMRVHHQGQR